MARSARLSPNHGDYTVACICPMGVELAPVEAMLDELYDPVVTSRDQNAYTLGRIGGHNIVIAVMPEVGNDAAATVATQLLNDFPSVRFSLLVGIGGGVPGDDGEDDVRLGDVVIGQPTQTFGGVVQYDLGKRLADGSFERTGQLNKPPEVLSANVRKLQAQHLKVGSQVPAFVSEMLRKYPKMKQQYECPGASKDILFDADYIHRGGVSCENCDETRVIRRRARPDSEPRIHYGTIGSANTVVRDTSVRDSLKKDMKIICVEMEAAGLTKNFQCLVIRGICDYADSHKNKMWQPYAAAVSAAYMKELLMLIPAAQVKRTESNKTEVTVSPFHLGLHFQDAPLIEASFFVGRETEIKKLEDILKPDDQSKEQGVLVLGGIGGIGKTQLAIEYARRHRSSYDSVFWLNVASETTIKDGYRAMAQSILSPEEYEACGNDQVVLRIRRWLSEKANDGWLLILDNYDEPEEYDIKEYYPFTTHGSIIITTRLPDRVSGKSVVLSPLDNVDDSLQILETRSGRRGVHSDHYARLLAERFEGLPLALATAGSYLKKNTLTFQQYLEVYIKRWNINPRRPTQLPEYKDRTLYTTWDLSLTRLEQEDPDAAQLLKLLAYFDNQRIWYALFQAGARPDSPDWVVDLTADEISFQNGMETLVDYCFLEIQASTSSFSMHACVHDWLLTGLTTVIDSQSYWYAFDCTVKSLGNDRDSGSLATREYRPLVPHATRLVHERFTKAGDYDDHLFNRLSEAIEFSSLLRAQLQPAVAEVMLQRALKVAETRLGPYDEYCLDIVYFLGLTQYALGNLEAAEQTYERVLANKENARPALIIHTRHEIGWLYQRQGKLEEAEEMYRTTLEEKETLFGSDNPSTINTVHNLGSLYHRQGKLSEAEGMYERSLASRMKTFGEDHISTLNACYDFARLYQQQAKFDLAEKMYDRALEGRVKRLGWDDRLTLQTAQELAILYHFDRCYTEQAELLYKRALAGYEKVCGENHLRTLHVTKNLSALYRKVGESQKAEELCKRALIGHEKVLGEENYWTTAVLQELIQIYLDFDQQDLARRQTERALAASRKLLASDPNSGSYAISLSKSLLLATRLHNQSSQIAYNYIVQMAQLTRGHGRVIYDRLGRAFLAVSDDSNALECFRRRAEYRGNSDEIDLGVLCDGCGENITTKAGRNVCRVCIDTDLCDSCLSRLHAGPGIMDICRIQDHPYFKPIFLNDIKVGQDEEANDSEEWLTNIINNYGKEVKSESEVGQSHVTRKPVDGDTNVTRPDQTT